MLRWRANLPMFTSDETAVSGRSVRAHYNAVSGVYDSSFGNRAGRGPDRRFRLLMELVPRDLYASAAPILEIGCGTGLYSQHLAKHFKGRYCGLDLSVNMLSVARESGSDNLVAADAARLPFADGSISAVFGFAVMHHIGNTASVFREVARVLSNHGALMLMEPNRLNPVNAALGLCKPIERGMLYSSRRRWQKEARASGLRMSSATRAAFLPSRPLVLNKIFDLAEPLMERLPLLSKLAIFDMMAFQRMD